jgi:hypothetical protein
MNIDVFTFAHNYRRYLADLSSKGSNITVEPVTARSFLQAYWDRDIEAAHGKFDIFSELSAINDDDPNRGESVVNLFISLHLMATKSCVNTGALGALPYLNISVLHASSFVGGYTVSFDITNDAGDIVPVKYTILFTTKVDGNQPSSAYIFLGGK